MAWIVISLFEIILSTLKGALLFFSINFIANIGINIGALLPTIDAQDRTLIQALNNMGNGEGEFDRVFAGASHFSTSFVTIAIALVFIIGILELCRAMIAPVNETEHPINIGAKMVGTSVLCALSYQIFINLAKNTRDFSREMNWLE